MRWSDCQPVRIGEPERSVIEALHVESALVHQPMVGRTQKDEVVERGLPAVGPVLDVMAVEPMGGGAQPGKRHPRSRLRSARRTAGGMLRVRRPTLSGSPLGPSTTGTIPASQHSRRAVSAAMAVRCSISQRPARPSASTSASTCTTISCRCGASTGTSFGSNIRSAIHASASARRTVRDGPRMNVPRGTSVRNARTSSLRWAVIGARAPVSVAASAGDVSCRDVPRGTSSGADPSLSRPAAGCSAVWACIVASSALRMRAPTLL